MRLVFAIAGAWIAFDYLTGKFVAAWIGGTDAGLWTRIAEVVRRSTGH